nr:SUKH-3 domain-containing protein [Streptomyces aidingensis]
MCTTLLAHFGLRSVAPSSEATTALRLPTGGARGTAGGGAAAPAAPAGAGRWPERPDRAAVEAERWSRELAAHRSPLGHRHTVTPAARAAWAEYGGLRLLPTGPGAVHVPVPVVLDPMLGRHWPRTLGDLGRALGTVLSPLGATGLPADGAGAGARAGDGDGDEAGCDGALLAVDREGRVYCLDHSGDWFLGPDVRSALTVLLTGARPHRLGPPPGPPGDARDGAAGGPAEAR